jgi:hypothetical protein
VRGNRNSHGTEGRWGWQQMAQVLRGGHHQRVNWQLVSLHCFAIQQFMNEISKKQALYWSKEIILVLLYFPDSPFFAYCGLLLWIGTIWGCCNVTVASVLWSRVWWSLEISTDFPIATVQPHGHTATLHTTTTVNAKKKWNRAMHELFAAA